MKIRMLTGILGTFENIDGGVKRGDIVDIPERNAKQYIASQIATAKLKGGLPPPYISTEESEALRETVMKEFAEKYRADMPELAPRPGAQPVGRHPGFPRQRVEGWGV